MNWQAGLCTPPNGSDYVNAVKYASLLAYKKYNITLDHPCIPVYNSITNNSYCNTSQFIDASPADWKSWLDIVENNTQVCPRFHGEDA
jgi:hypothetical protein